MKVPLISVIVPAYNIASYVEKTIASIAAQTYRNIEIIIIDDGSTDATGAILDRLEKQDQRVRVIHKENGGVTSARLRGVAEATGEWIGFVDGDDYIEPDMYEHLLNNAIKYEADISHCGYQMIFPKGHVDYYYNTGRLEQHDGAEGVRMLIAGSYIEPSLGNKLFRRTLFDRMLQNELMDLRIRINEDVLMNYYLFSEAEKSVYEDVCMYHYLLHENSAATSGISEHKLKAPLKVTRIIYKDTEAVPAVHAVAQRRYVQQLIYYAVLVNYPENELVRACRRDTLRELRGSLNWILRSANCSMKIKIMALWVALLPGTYACVKRAYLKLKKREDIYSLDK